MKDLEIRQIRPEEYRLVADLINSLYAIKRPIEYYGGWQWSNDLLPSILLGAFNKDSLVGLFGIQKRILNNNLTVGYITNLNVAKEWQGKGLFSTLGKKAMKSFDNLDIFCVFANANAKYPCERSLGLKTIGTIRMMILKTSERLNQINYKCIPIDLMTNFPDIMINPEKIMFQYTQEFRQWRFAKNPLYSYSKITIETGEYAIIKKFTDPVKGVVYGDIVDCECSLDDIQRLEHIYSAAINQLINEGADQITTMALPGTILHSVVEKIGFRASDYESYFEVKAVKTGHDSLYDFSKWHLRQADGMNY